MCESYNCPAFLELLYLQSILLMCVAIMQITKGTGREINNLNSTRACRYPFLEKLLFTCGVVKNHIAHTSSRSTRCASRGSCKSPCRELEVNKRPALIADLKAQPTCLASLSRRLSHFSVSGFTASTKVPPLSSFDCPKSTTSSKNRH
jgi:hypothetical protein